MASIKSYMNLITLAAKLPGPQILPIVGNATIFAGSPEDIFKKIVDLTKQYESPSRYWLGSNLTVVVSKPEDIQIVLNDAKTMEKADIYRCFSDHLGGDGVLTAPVEKWKNLRPIISSVCDIKLRQGFMPVFNKHNNILVEKLKPLVDRGQFDIWKYMSSACLDMIFETTVGVDETIPEKEKTEFDEAINTSYEQLLIRCYNSMLPSNVLFKLVEGLSIGFSPSGRLSNKVYYLPNMIIEKKKSEYKHMKGQSDKDNEFKSFLEALLASSDSGAKITDELIRDEVMGTILEGYGPIALTNCFCLLILAINENIQENLHKEISGIYKSTHDVTYEDLKQMTYTEMVIKETLRMYPVIPVYLRAVKEDIQLTKHKLPAGCTVVIFPMATHMDSKIYPNPTEFNPENFTKERIAQRHKYSYVPFSAGPRRCLGYMHTMFSVKTTLAHLIRNYKFTTNIKPEDIKLKMDLLLRSSNGFPLKITQRKQ